MKLAALRWMLFYWATYVYLSIGASTCQSLSDCRCYFVGAGVFVTAIVSGAVIISKPFQCMERPLLRDITFYIVAVFYTFYIMQSRQITTLQAVGVYVSWC